LEDPAAIRLVAVVELPPVLVDVFLRRVVGSMVGARVEPQEPGPRGVRGLLVAQHADGVIDEILGEVIALLRPLRRLGEVISLNQVRVPPVRLAAEEAVEAVEPLLKRPLLARRPGGDVLLRHVMVFADPERAPAAVLENLTDGRGLIGNAPARARE